MINLSRSEEQFIARIRRIRRRRKSAYIGMSVLTIGLLLAAVVVGIQVELGLRRDGISLMSLLRGDFADAVGALDFISLLAVNTGISISVTFFVGALFSLVSLSMIRRLYAAHDMLLRFVDRANATNADGGTVREGSS